ncbi:MAG: enoyl-CoA hydratase/isomerase family protein [Oscillospiraceae bacterium]|nr:enoyl-CoA hydratase/isomerase family protein [Oscillospiraceae bacterium]
MDQLIYKKLDHVGVLQINRPEALNALSREIVDAMDAELDKIAADPEVRVLLIGGTDNFAAGADIKGMVECDPEGARKFSFSPTYKKLMDLKIPTIASVGGYCFGGGLELALTCDFRIASEEAQMGLVETNLGIFPGAGGTIRLPRLIGYSQAMELILFGKKVKGPEALQLGLVNRIVPKEDLWEESIKWATKLSLRAPVAVQSAKQTIKAGLAMQTIDAGIDYEADAWANLFLSQDQKEGMRAFVEKRKPNYIGK